MVFFLTALAAAPASSAPKHPLYSTQEKTLANGLKVLVLEDHSAAGATVMTWVKAGSRNEYPGITGVSHFLEHMYSMGTRRVQPREYSKIVKRVGGYKNAFTSQDYTAYYFRVPSTEVEKFIDLEADRLQNLALPEERFTSEKQVVREERRMRLGNSPTGAFSEAMGAMAYMAHPYRWPVLGWDSDIQELTVERMREYYQAHYVPGNIVLVVVGDVRTEQVFGWAEQYFGGIDKGEAPPEVHTVEPEQQGERRFEMRKGIPLPMVRIAWHVPEVTHKDYPALVCLDAVLSAGRSSRLQKRLVRGSAIASEAGAWVNPRHDGSLFYMAGTAAAGHEADEIEAALLAQVEDIVENGVDADELKKVKKQLRAGAFLDLESNQDKARVLGAWECLDSWRGALKYHETLELVTAEQVKAAAKDYLNENRTVGWLLPEDSQ